MVQAEQDKYQGHLQAAGPLPSLSSQLLRAERWWLLCPQTGPVTPETEDPRTMWRLRAAFLLLTACLAVSASPVLIPPDDIQTQENFDISRVRLASLAAMAGCPSSWALQGAGLPIWNSGLGPSGPFLLGPFRVC